MRNTWLLLKVQTSALLGFNKIRHIKDKKERWKKTAARVAYGFCVLMLLAVFGAFAFIFGLSMDALGQIGLFPGFMLAATCVMTLISSVAIANGTLFSFKDYELIMSLPVKPIEVAASRLIIGYICNAGFDLMVMLPCGAVYAYFVQPAFAFYPIYLFTMLAAPVVPMIVGTMIGALAARLTASFRGGKYIQMIASTVLSLGIMFFSMNMNDAEEFSIFSDWGVMISDMMNRIYPLTGLFVSAVRDLNWGAALLFLLISAAFMTGAALLTGRWLGKINSLMNATYAKRNFRMRALNTSSPTMALYKKELKRYVSTPIYLFNTAFSLVLAVVAVVLMALNGRDVLKVVLMGLEFSGMEQYLIVCVLGYIGAFMVITACTSSCSISLEGKQLWLIQSLPVSGFSVLLSKVLVNLTLTVPISLVIGIGMVWATGLETVHMAAVTAMCLAYSLMSACLGLFVNLKNHNFEWTTETVVVKQSASVGISIGVGMALIALPAVATFLFMDYALLVFGLTTVLMTAVGVGLLYAFRLRGDQWIRAL